MSQMLAEISGYTNNIIYSISKVLVIEPEFSERMSKEEYEGLKVE